ncbi:LPS export ABC transporter protein LptC [Dysgonomonas hofstadii]|uniref:LPS export ABC transporter protein LptC n=1 Tax=Dysgonomonas hofstadii TaxID=637886 RepID=A0A840CQV5_9BACT|nr:LPS export ABC transporter periplasmic protein LptC [Dysgonomonas hofstadii]MBB4035984.1 LPS export ABC transporter protein LptC [Dysgonomonas hofstadii]
MRTVQKKIGVFAMVFFIFTIPFFFAACKSDKKSSVGMTYDPEIIPSMNTDSVSMLISDSGLIRYKMIAKTWEVFDQAKDPYWYYPDGLYLEQFDTTFNVVVTVQSDTAWNYEKKKLWRLKGNVFVRNSVGETFSSDELYWDQQKEKIYSDKYVEVDRPEKGILRGKGGFEANQQMTEYQFKKVGRSDKGGTLLYFNEDSQNLETIDGGEPEEKAE